MLRKTKSILFGTLGVALVLGMLTPPARAAVTLLEGDLFFTTFVQTTITDTPCNGGANPAKGDPGCFNVWKIHFVYDNTPIVTLSGRTGIATLCGADGLVFDPNTEVGGDPTTLKLLVGEQGVGVGGCNKVAEMAQNGGGLIEVGSNGIPANPGQAFSLVTSGGTLVAFPNDDSSNPDWIGNKFTTVPIPLVALGNGSAVSVGGDEMSVDPAATSGLKGGAILGGTLYYGDAIDRSTGHFGSLTLGGFTTRLSVKKGGIEQSTVLVGSGLLPSHALETDLFSGCIILSGGTELWQNCLVAGQWTITSFLSNPSGVGNANWDQTINDSLGHMFAADNTGDLLFVDYSGSATKVIGDATSGGVVGKFFQSQHLAVALDDIAFVKSVVPTGCPATKGFWANHGLPAQGQPSSPPVWPHVTNTFGGVAYDGIATPPTMTIGGHLYTQAQLITLLTENTKGNGELIAGSQLIAAVLNIANGVSSTLTIGGVTVDASSVISQINTILTNNSVILTSPSTLSKALNDQLKALGGQLDTYNDGAATLGCVEGTPGT